MANQEHLDILMQGVEVWNAWREEFPKVRPDLRSANLSHANMSGANLGGANLSHANMNGANLSYANLSHADLNNASLVGVTLDGATLNDANLCCTDLSGANLSNANLSSANLSTADLSGAILSHCYLRGTTLNNATLNNATLNNATLSGATLSDADLRNADLNHAILIRATLSSADLRDADLSSADLRDADLSSATLSSADLRDADLSSATLSSADLRDADLSSATLSSADLRNADLSSATLRDADLNSANLIGVILSSTNLRNADLTSVTVGWTIFGDLDLRIAKGLETIKHKGPSTIGTDTILKSEGDIPESFLRGAGLDDIFISYVLSLARKPIQYYTCFISYSSKDQAFAERLYADLQNNNVRCWYAPEDLKIGDKFRVRIDESIRLYDKLLLILSEHSVRSPWVETEVETAFSKEHKTRKLALFPVKLDNTVEETEEAWAATIHRTRHIGDFTRWKDHDEYQKGLSRLLRDLKQDVTTENLAKE